MKIGYARVSSKSQADTEALNQQINRLKKAGAEQVLFDVQSGMDSSRSNYKELLKLVKNGVATEVITTRLDRLGRHTIEIHRAIEIFKKYKIKYTNLDMKLDGSGSPTEWFTIQTISALAELESRSISERTKHGLDYFRQNRKYFSIPPFGYAKDENSKLIPHPSNWKIAKAVCDRLRSQSKASISRWLMDKYGISFYPTHFRRWILNPALRGHTTYKVNGKTEIHYNTHPALLSESEYSELVETCGLKIRYKPNNQGKVYFLAGLLKCGICGGSLSRSGVSKKNPQTTRFQCSRFKRLGTKACTNKKTIAQSIVKRETIAQLQLYAHQITQEIDTLADEPNKDDPELLRLQQQIVGLKKLGDNPAIANAILDLERQISNREHQRSTRSSTIKEDKKILYAFRQADFWEELSDEELRSICLRFIDSVKYSGGKELNFSMRALV